MADNEAEDRLEGDLAERARLILEARVGFEPTNGGFADLSLGPLGYRAGAKKYSETGVELSGSAPEEEARL